MQKLRYLKIINVFAYVAMVAVNIAAESLPLNGVTSGQVSDSYASLFTPAGITFSIWSIIYLGLAYFTFWQLLYSNGEAVEKLGIYFAASCALNIAWLILWHFKLIYLATAVIVALLFVLAKMRQYIQGENWAIKATFSIYQAWILMATIASIFILAGNVFAKFSYSILAQILVCLVLAVAAIDAFIKLKSKRDYAWALTIAWATSGIVIKHIMQSGFAAKYIAIIVTAIIGVIAIVVSMVLGKKKVEVAQ